MPPFLKQTFAREVCKQRLHIMPETTNKVLKGLSFGCVMINSQPAAVILCNELSGCEVAT